LVKATNGLLDHFWWLANKKSPEMDSGLKNMVK